VNECSYVRTVAWSARCTAMRLPILSYSTGPLSGHASGSQSGSLSVCSSVHLSIYPTVNRSACPYIYPRLRLRRLVINPTSCCFRPQTSRSGVYRYVPKYQPFKARAPHRRAQRLDPGTSRAACLSAPNAQAGPIEEIFLWNRTAPARANVAEGAAEGLTVD
jgi:hypothetical protein